MANIPTTTKFAIQILSMLTAEHKVWKIVRFFELVGIITIYFHG